MKMDILQMNYLISVVESNCNLSLAAKQIHVTQSALSQFILNFEKEEGIQLFRRKNGRLVELTQAGRDIYEGALEITRQYDTLQEMVQQKSRLYKGSIRIGMPSTILRVLFSRFFPKFMTSHPEIDIEIIEDNEKNLRQRLMDNDLHYAVLVEPTLLDESMFEQHILGFSEIAAFMDPTHEIARKQILSWRDLDDELLVSLNEGFESHTLIKEKLEHVHSTSRMLLTSSSWDYLVEACVGSELIALLPTARFNRYIDRLNKIGVVEKRFKDPLPYTPMLCRPIKKKYTNSETFVFETILNGFYRVTESEEEYL